MSKTAVTVLQEVCTKLGTLPGYTEILSMVETYQRQFTIRVSWKNYNTEGTAANKKEAKQNAAKNMLLLLLSSNEIPEKILLSFPNLKADFKLNTSMITNNASSINLSDSHTKICTNYIGLLKEYCEGQNLPAPNYATVGNVGPSHLPMFAISCTVDTVRYEGCANTKQAAKHQAAKKVLENLKNKSCSNIKCNTEASDAMVALNVEFIKVSLDQFKYNKLKEEKIVKTSGPIIKELVLCKPHIKIEDYVTVLSDLCRNITAEDNNLLSVIYNKFSTVDLNTLKTIICRAFKTSMEETSFKSIDNDSLIGVKLNIYPVVFQIGTGNTIEQARKCAFYKLLQYIFLLSQ